MTANAVPTTSCRGCPSIAAGTTCGGDTSRISPYALPTANWCRTDTPTATLADSHPTCLPAWTHSYTRPRHQPIQHGLEGHGSMLHHRPQSVSTTSCRG